MDNLKSAYEDIINSSEEYHDLEDVVPGESNIDKSFEKEINSYQDILKDEGIGGLRRALSENSNKWKNIGLHIAVTGTSGAGKSSFINAIRDVSAEDKGAAKVGVTETTTKLTPFTHPKNPNFIVWDMPGVGTPKYPRQNYLEYVKFDRYDFFMILSQSRFTEDDLWLAKEIQKRGKRFYFIRTNIDIDILKDERSHKKTHSPQQVMDKVTLECQKNLTEAGFDKPVVFLVDNLDQQKYDFGKLGLQLVADSDSLKMEAMALSLSSLTQEILQKKKEILKERIDEKAMEIACLLFDIRKQKEIFDEEMSIYREQFCLDKETLDANKDILSLSNENLEEFKTFFKTISIAIVYNLVLKYSVSVSLARWLINIVRKWKGISRTAYSEPVLQFSCLALHQNLERIHKIALKVYDLDAQKGLVQSCIVTDNK